MQITINKETEGTLQGGYKIKYILSIDGNIVCRSQYLSTISDKLTEYVNKEIEELEEAFWK